MRHAEVHGDWQGKAYGNLDVPLSSEGEERTREMVRDFARVGPARIVSSPLQRAHVLGRGLAEAWDRALELSPALAEIHRGDWQGRSVAELYRTDPASVQAFYDDPWAWRGHGGENDRMLWERAWPAIQDQTPQAGPETLVVTTHYNVIRVLTAGLLGIPAERSFGLRVDPGHAVLLVSVEDGWTLHGSNLHGPEGHLR